MSAPCEICGCSYCHDGDFPMGDPTGTVPTEAFFGVSDDVDDFLDTFGVEGNGEDFLSCALLDSAASRGLYSPIVCNDQIQTIALFRDSCGCPPLPPAVPTPTISPIAEIPEYPFSRTPTVTVLDSPPRSPDAKRRFTFSSRAQITTVVVLSVIGLLAIAILINAFGLECLYRAKIRQQRTRETRDSEDDEETKRRSDNTLSEGGDLQGVIHHAGSMTEVSDVVTDTPSTFCSPGETRVTQHGMSLRDSQKELLTTALKYDVIVK